MKNWGKVETGIVLTISINHLPEKAIEDLAAVHDEKCANRRYDSDHWTKRLTWMTFDYGFGVSAGSLAINAKDHAGEHPFLDDLHEFAKDFDASWIVFDQDGDAIEGLRDFHEDIPEDA